MNQKQNPFSEVQQPEKTLSEQGINSAEEVEKLLASLQGNDGVIDFGDGRKIVKGEDGKYRALQE